MDCIDCGSPIPEERLEILTERGWPLHCIKCSKVEAPVAFMNYTHKTAGDIVVVPNNPDGTRDLEKVRIAERVYRRSR